MCKLGRSVPCPTWQTGFAVADSCYVVTGEERPLARSAGFGFGMRPARIERTRPCVDILRLAQHIANQGRTHLEVHA